MLLLHAVPKPSRWDGQVFLEMTKFSSQKSIRANLLATFFLAKTRFPSFFFHFHIPKRIDEFATQVAASDAEPAQPPVILWVKLYQPPLRSFTFHESMETLRIPELVPDTPGGLTTDFLHHFPLNQIQKGINLVHIPNFWPIKFNPHFAGVAD